MAQRGQAGAARWAGTAFVMTLCRGVLRSPGPSWRVGAAGRSAAAAALLAGAAACGAVTTAEEVAADVVSAPGIDVVADGGIAALHTMAHIDSATGAVYWVFRAICAPAVNCTPNDSLSGTVTGSLVENLYGRAATPEFRALRRDYGLTVGSADMRSYTLVIRANGTSRTLQADDGTMPTLMAQFVNDVTLAVNDVVRR